MMEFTSDVGRVVFRPIGYRQLSIEMDFKEGAGQQALDVCRRALAIQASVELEAQSIE